jgi:hypothetical protein
MVIGTNVLFVLSLRDDVNFLVNLCFCFLCLECIILVLVMQNAPFISVLLLSMSKIYTVKVQLSASPQ